MRNLLVIVCTMLVVTGCAEPRIVEEMGFMHGIGYEMNEAENAEEEGVLIVTITFPQVSPTAEEQRVILTTTAQTSKEARTKLARQTERVLVSGQLRTALFSNNIAERGFLDTIDTLKRDHTIGLNIKIIVVNGSTKEFFMTDFPQHPRTGRYIYDLIDKEAQSQITVDTSLYDFLRDYYDDGIDAMVPLVKKGQDQIIIDGIGLFKGDQLVMKVDPKASRIFKMLHGDYMGGTITNKIHLKNEPKNDYLFITFTTLESKRKVNVKGPEDITIDVNVKGAIEEYTGYLPLSEDEVQKELEKKLGDHIKKVSEAIIKEMQKKQTDSLGIGQYVRNSLSYEQWKNMNWKEEVYPTANISVNVNVKLKGYGSVK